MTDKISNVYQQKMLLEARKAKYALDKLRRSIEPFDTVQYFESFTVYFKSFCDCCRDALEKANQISKRTEIYEETRNSPELAYLYNFSNAIKHTGRSGVQFPIVAGSGEVLFGPLGQPNAISIVNAEGCSVTIGGSIPLKARNISAGSGQLLSGEFKNAEFGRRSKGNVTLEKFINLEKKDAVEYDVPVIGGVKLTPVEIAEQGYDWMARKNFQLL